MKILEYSGLDLSRVGAAYRKVTQAIASGDFRAAQVKKMGLLGTHPLYRARLNDADRLLFVLVRHGDETCALMLEVVLRHAYADSRFLRGADIDESRIQDAEVTEASSQAQVLRYLHPQRTVLHLLEKPISFDDTQQAVFEAAAPLVVVGSAGSGKTALLLEKLKQATGEVLYVTHSPFLAQSARDLYYAHGFEHSGQEAVFLSYREFLETLQVPKGREAQWRDFAPWFARMRSAFKGLDAHQVFEDIRGVITASHEGVLSREAYRALGVRQSIFPVEQRDAVYDLFDKYRQWLKDSGLFDLNLVAHEWMSQAAPRYDWVVIDEVQDLTTVQLALVLKTLTHAGQFLLCGDANQIVHPNFFAWSQVKRLFWSDPELAARQELQVLSANFRNGLEATRVANRLLRIKQQRFGSIDRESHFLVQAIGTEAGAVHLLEDKAALRQNIDQQIRQSTQFAVLVMREEDKAEARQHFRTPLLFSIHEAKGLEYDNIVLYRFVSEHRSEFADMVDGVRVEDLDKEDFAYRRARDKQDKSLESYKFFVNALYVALTRAVRNLYIIESDTRHPLWALLGLSQAEQVKVEARQASVEDWQKEARKLELQGKQEQADAIRERILKQVPVPWPVTHQARAEELLHKVFREQVPGSKFKQQVYEYAACYNLPLWAGALVSDARFEAATRFEQQRVALGQKSYHPYAARHVKDILRQCDTYGVEHRLPMNMTPLMAAAAMGNVSLVEQLLERGADREAVDDFGWNALHWALQRAFDDAQFAQESIAALYERLAPASVDVSTGQRLVRIDRHLSEYLLFQTLWVLFRSCFTHPQRQFHAAVESQRILQVWSHLPAAVLRPERNKRTHVSGVLSRNEVDRDYAYNRMLFRRVSVGWYQFNPLMSVRRRQGGEEQWVSIWSALNLNWVAQAARPTYWHAIDRYLEWAGLPPRAGVPLVLEGQVARQEAERLAQEKAREEHEQLLKSLLAMRRPPRGVPTALASEKEEHPWGTPAARRAAIQKVRQQQTARRQTKKD